MNYKIILPILLLLLSSCANELNKKKINIKNNRSFFINKGFTLIYDDNFYANSRISEKVDDRSMLIFQKNLKEHTKVRVTNLINSKYIVATVGKNATYPSFYNSVVSKRISKELEINLSEPYVEIKEIIEGSTFVAKKAKIFDEEKNVATKAPIDSVQIKNLFDDSVINNDISVKEFKYIIKIADFYFKNSAKQMKIRIMKETSIKKVYIKQLSKTKFRVFIGAYNDINSLKKSFNAINVLEFDNLEIIRN